MGMGIDRVGLILAYTLFFSFLNKYIKVILSLDFFLFPKPIPNYSFLKLRFSTLDISKELLLTHNKALIQHRRTQLKYYTTKHTKLNLYGLCLSNIYTFMSFIRGQGKSITGLLKIEKYNFYQRGHFVTFH